MISSNQLADMSQLSIDKFPSGTLILLHQSGELTIRFNFADQYQRILDFIENNERELVVLGETHSA